VTIKPIAFVSQHIKAVCELKESYFLGGILCRSLLITFQSFCECVGDVEMGKVLFLTYISCQICEVILTMLKVSTINRY
jgi:hypothetical protein